MSVSTQLDSEYSFIIYLHSFVKTISRFMVEHLVRRKTVDSTKKIFTIRMHIENLMDHKLVAEQNCDFASRIVAVQIAVLLDVIRYP